MKTHKQSLTGYLVVKVCCGAVATAGLGRRRSRDESDSRVNRVTVCSFRTRPPRAVHRTPAGDA